PIAHALRRQDSSQAVAEAPPLIGRNEAGKRLPLQHRRVPLQHHLTRSVRVQNLALYVGNEQARGGQVEQLTRTPHATLQVVAKLGEHRDTLVQLFLGDFQFLQRRHQDSRQLCLSRRGVRGGSSPLGAQHRRRVAE